MLKLKSIKTQLILYLVCFAIFLSIKDRDVVFLVATVIAVISSLAVESLFLYFKTKILQAVILHNTNNPDRHYVKKVDVALNGKEIIEHSISREDNNQSQTVAYLTPDVKDNDVLSVEGYCSLSGKLKKEITVKIEK